MISHEHKCIFIHIPKCAGTSIESALGHLDGHTGRGGQDHRSIRTIEEPLITPKIFSSKENVLEVARRLRYKVRAVKNPRNKLTLTREQYNNYFKFTFIRNPWSRAYSWYKNVMRDEIHQKNLNINNQLTFNQCLQLCAGKGMLRPQTYWIKDFSGSIPLDFVGKFESLNEDFIKALKMMDASQITLPHKIKGADEDYREHYDKNSINLILEVYKEEIDMFGYSF